MAGKCPSIRWSWCASYAEASVASLSRGHISLAIIHVSADLAPLPMLLSFAEPILCILDPFVFLWLFQARMGLPITLFCHDVPMSFSCSGVAFERWVFLDTNQVKKLATYGKKFAQGQKANRGTVEGEAGRKNFLPVAPAMEGCGLRASTWRRCEGGRKERRREEREEGRT